MTAAVSLLEVSHLAKRFPMRRRPFSRAAPSFLHAVDDVNFAIAAGECVGLVGESGCGKSTLVRVLARLLDATEGSIGFDGEDLAAVPAARFARHPRRREMQVVFQDPTESLNPRYTAADSIAEPLRLLEGLSNRAEIARRVEAAAADVGLPAALLGRFPHQLSGGQKARVNIARAVAVRPRLLILDEPTAALDVSVQAIVLALLAELREKLGLAYLFVSHDLNVVRLMCDRVMVMYLGRIVESGPAAEVFANPAHPYTRLLVDALPRLGTEGGAVQLPAGEPTSPIDPDPKQCRYASRCPQARPRCSEVSPGLRHAGAGREVACHFPLFESHPENAA
jgi:oligopeptide/dipeptide ABC transporter ATP-binding protein